MTDNEERLGINRFGKAWDWYKYGLEHDDDLIIKFVMHWLAFNWLYNGYQGDNESARIASFYDENKHILDRYDPFSDPAIDIFLEAPVHSMTSDHFESDRRYAEGLYQRIKRSNPDVKALLKTIYRVRCNLFHGAKSPNNSRDRKLVEASSVILEKYLKEYIKG